MRVPALRRAQRDDRSVTMEDVKKWRIENYNLEKRPRKFNSWAANRPFEELQADLHFFDDLRQREQDQRAGGLCSGALGPGHLQVENCGCSYRGETNTT